MGVGCVEMWKIIKYILEKNVYFIVFFKCDYVVNMCEGVKSSFGRWNCNGKGVILRFVLCVI